MTTWYIATRARYELVEAESEATARQLGAAALGEHFGDRPFEIRTVRPATADEIELANWHDEMVAREL